MISRALLAAVVVSSLSYSSLVQARACESQTTFPQHDKFLEWARGTNGKGVRFLSEKSPIEAVRQNRDEFVYPRKVDIQTRKDMPALSPEQRCRMNTTAELYYETFGRSTLESFLWSGVEVGNPLTSDMSYRWNSLRLSGMYDPVKRQKMIQTLQQLGIRNLRFGLTNHEILPKALKALKPGHKWTLTEAKRGWDDESWRPFDEMIDHLSKSGIRISLDMHHFGVETWFSEDSQGRFDPNPRTYDPTRSFYLNPKWPEYFSEFALEAFKRYRGKIQAVTIINEPTIVSGFNSQLWHGGFPTWGSPLNDHYEVKRAIALGIASVKARIKIERYIQLLPEAERKQARVVYLQSDGMGSTRHNFDFNQTVRYLTLDFVLGHDWVYTTDFKKLKAESLENLHSLAATRKGPFEHAVGAFIFKGQPDNRQIRERQRDELFTLLEKLQRLHLRLHKEIGQSMQDFTVLGIDYYSHNEVAEPDGTPLSKEPQNYALEVRSGKRVGMYNVGFDYWQRYPMPIMITETGTAYWAYGSAWNQQMLVESAKFADNGIPFLGLALYPAVDTYGWEHALSQKRDSSILNESGIMNFDMDAKPYMRPILDSLTSVLPRK